MAVQILPRSFWQRLLGICATPAPRDPSCWSVTGTTVTVDLNKAPELGPVGGAIRLEGGTLAKRVLVIRGPSGAYHAFANHCAHMGRRLDPVPGTATVQCCSIGKSTFDLNGKRLAGSAGKDIIVYPLSQTASRLTIETA